MKSHEEASVCECVWEFVIITSGTSSLTGRLFDVVLQPSLSDV